MCALLFDCLGDIFLRLHNFNQLKKNYYSLLRRFSLDIFNQIVCEVVFVDHRLFTVLLTFLWFFVVVKYQSVKVSLCLIFNDNFCLFFFFVAKYSGFYYRVCLTKNGQVFKKDEWSELFLHS